MWGVLHSRNMPRMHPLLMTALANERSLDMRADAAMRRRSRLALSRIRRASARRVRRDRWGSHIAHV
jgi:hypothetical protein